jgi:hypothetical protein
MNYRVDGWADGTKTLAQVLSVADWCQKGSSSLATQPLLVFPLQETLALYLRDLSWKISKEALEIDIV